MFTRSADFYDAIYEEMGKDYAAEARALHDQIEGFRRSPGNRLLDVACGTGAHLPHLKEWYEVEGLDLDPKMLEIARERCPGVPLHEADMLDFDLGREFDAVACLFSSIGYARDRYQLESAVRAMARHLRPGGVLVVEPWLDPEEYLPGRLWAHFVDRPDLKVARMNVSAVEGEVSIIEFHYLVGRPEGIEHFTERHELGLFPREAYEEAFRGAGLGVTYDVRGLMGRGLLVGTKPAG